ncbi:SigE family RNA polymerase sigma factor [Aquihabitans sp. McL0605]|uniref:SigE family RNA polymerase sigma factor n=1 Tax=Aquihabitans sp. McL0605 TaxID=3415671 RepID=UPI003CED8D8B
MDDPTTTGAPPPPLDPEPDPHRDLPLVFEIGHGRTYAFDAVFRADHRAIVALVWALSGSRAVAEEITQEAFLKAHVRWDRIGRYDNPGAWVRRVAINLATSNRRRGQAEERALGRIGGVSEAADRTADVVGADRFWSAVRTLPERQQAVVALHYLEDRSVVDVAEVLGIAEGTVKAHLHKARAALAARLVIDPEDAR